MVNRIKFILVLKIIIYLCLFVFSDVCLLSNIIINEFQAYPTDEEPEWVELYNNSNKSITIDSLIIKDNKTSKFIGRLTLKSGAFLIITKDTIDLKNKYPNIQSNLDNKLLESNFPALNNTTDEIKIYNGSKLMDSLNYDMKLGVKGNSFERVDVFSSANVIGNLKPSRSINKATPLIFNSWVKVDYDLEIESLNVKNTYNTDYTYTTNLEVSVLNFGIKDINKSNLNISLIYNNEITSLIDFEVNPLISNNKQTFNLDITNLISQTNFGGNLKFRAIVSNTLDQRKESDTLYLTHYISYRSGSLLINEFITDVQNNFAFISDSNTTLEKNVMGEFLEIYNNSIFEINLKNYSIDDASTYNSNSGIRIEKDLIIKANEYAVITWDSAFFNSFDSLKYSLVYSDKVYHIHKPSFNLNITSDFIVLRDEYLTIMDSVNYTDKWSSDILNSTKNISLERINPNGNSNDEINWTSCLDLKGATPLKSNSISLVDNTSINNIDIAPNPFSPKNSGIKSNCKISYSFDFEYVNITIKIFDMYGNVISDLINNRALPNKYTIIWEGTDNSGNILPVGAYVLFVEAVDLKSGKVNQLKKLIAIGE